MAATSRKRPARRARIVVTGLSTGGTFAIVAALSAAASGTSTATEESADDALSADEYMPDPEVEDTGSEESGPGLGSIVVIELHRTVYVDEFGHPVDPTQIPITASAQPLSPATKTTTEKASTKKATTKKATTKKATTKKATAPKKKATKKKVPKKKATPKCTGSTC